jgi:hypothetical protein
VEQDELGKLLSRTGARRRHSEKEWRAKASGGANRLEAVFLADSYGYRPGKSALDAVGMTPFDPHPSHHRGHQLPADRDALATQ